MASAPFIIYTYGNQDIVYEILMSISMFFGGGLILSMVKLACVTTILLFLFNAIGITTSNQNRPLDLMFFMRFYLVYAIFVLVGTPNDIVIQDTMTNQPRTISKPARDSIPLGLILINSYTSQVFYGLIKGYERYFSTGSSGNPALCYTKSGMAFGSNFVATLPSASSGDPIFDENLQNYFGNCGLPIAYSKGGMTELIQSNDIIEFFYSNKDKDYKQIQEARFVAQIGGKGEHNIVSCWSALENIRATWIGKSSSYLSYFATLAGYSDLTAIANFNAASNASTERLLKISANGSDALKQAIAMNIAYKSIQTNATQVNNEALALAAYDAQQFQQYKAGGELSGTQAARVVPALKNFAEALLYMLYPLMVFYALLASSFSPVAKYIKFSATINAIPLIYEILSWGINWYAINKTGAIATTSGFNMLTASNMYNLNANIVAAANWLSMSTPALAYMIISGSDMAITGIFGHATDSGKSISTSTGADKAKGTLNMGNTNMDNTSYGNTSYNNLSANKFNSAMDMTTGSSQMNRKFDSGSVVSTFGDSTSVINTPVSSGPISSTASTANTKQLSESYNQAIQAQEQASSDMSSSYKVAGQYAAGHGLTWSGSHDKNSGVDIMTKSGSGANNEISEQGKVGFSVKGGSNGGAITGGADASFGSATQSRSGWDNSTISKDMNSWKHSDIYGKDEKFTQMVDKVDSAQHRYSNSISKSEALQEQLSIAKSDVQQLQRNQNSEIWNKMVSEYGINEAQKRFNSLHERQSIQNDAAEEIGHPSKVLDMDSGHKFVNNAESKFDKRVKQAQNNAEAEAKIELNKNKDRIVEKSNEGIENSEKMTKGSKVHIPSRQEWSL